MPKKGSIYSDIVIGDLVPGGDARGVFVEDGSEHQLHFNARVVAPGDVVNARILAKGKGFYEAVVESVVEHTTIRRKPECPHFGTCGGCSLQHISYPIQLKLKEGIVRQCLGQRLDGIQIHPTIACASEFRFRNKMEFTASSRAFRLDMSESKQTEPALAIGLFVPFSGNKVLNLSTCLLQGPVSDRIRLWTAQYAARNNLSYYHSGTHRGFLRTILIRTNRSGEALVMFVIGETDLARIDELCAACARDIPEVQSLWYLVNEKMNDSYADLSPVHAAGALHISETIGTLNFRVGPQTFLQVNTAQAEVLYQKIMDSADLHGTETVYDLYCGVGTITAWAAQRAATVVGIEYSASSVVAAREACAENNIPNATFYAGDMKDLLVPDLFALHGMPDVVITDPPRAGMHPKACAVLAASGAKRIVYVSCNPESLARDLDILSGPYKIESVQAVDLMPQSHHIETLVVLELK